MYLFLQFNLHTSIAIFHTTCSIIILTQKGMIRLAKHSGPSWKKEHPSTLTSNSVQKADRAVKQVMSHPEEVALEHAFNSISRAENSLKNAEQKEEHMDIVEQNKTHLNELKQQLHEVKEIVEDQ